MLQSEKEENMIQQLWIYAGTTDPNNRPKKWDVAKGKKNKKGGGTPKTHLNSLQVPTNSQKYKEEDVAEC